ncbi:uncharacterized protein SCODWIG_00013 [Saccharomycodes ludwigii]|uniref:Xylanolytic transcriptional activator regulatory domain-containing protein n=1 Tax=Saccharomycodes ludwigii TaxID=36035 RepID=A0A376B0T7_9ASCO|nr:uncharacterized protein SCODWIG_00013 [Saccharomycodes ludwigii]
MDCTYNNTKFKTENKSIGINTATTSTIPVKHNVENDDGTTTHIKISTNNKNLAVPAPIFDNNNNVDSINNTNKKIFSKSCAKGTTSKSGMKNNSTDKIGSAISSSGFLKSYVPSSNVLFTTDSNGNVMEYNENNGSTNKNIHDNGLPANSRTVEDTRKVLVSFNTDQNHRTISKKVFRSVRKQRMLKEFVELKNRFDLLENLLLASLQEQQEEDEEEEEQQQQQQRQPHPESIIYNQPQIQQSIVRSQYSSSANTPTNWNGLTDSCEDDPELFLVDPQYGLADLPKMNFYDGYEQVSELCNRLTFSGPLAFISVCKRDPFAFVLVTMITKTRHEIARRFETKTQEKYARLRVTTRYITQQFNIDPKVSVQSPISVTHNNSFNSSTANENDNEHITNDPPLTTSELSIIPPHSTTNSNTNRNNNCTKKKQYSINTGKDMQNSLSVEDNILNKRDNFTTKQRNDSNRGNVTTYNIRSKRTNDDIDDKLIVSNRKKNKTTAEETVITVDKDNTDNCKQNNVSEEEEEEGEEEEGEEEEGEEEEGEEEEGEEEEGEEEEGEEGGAYRNYGKTDNVKSLNNEVDSTPQHKEEIMLNKTNRTEYNNETNSIMSSVNQTESPYSGKKNINNSSNNTNKDSNNNNVPDNTSDLQIKGEGGKVVEKVFEQKLLENEGLDEMDSIFQEGKIANNPLSVENLINKHNHLGNRNRLNSEPHSQNSNKNDFFSTNISGRSNTIATLTAKDNTLRDSSNSSQKTLAEFKSNSAPDIKILNTKSQNSTNPITNILASSNTKGMRKSLSEHGVLTDNADNSISGSSNKLADYNNSDNYDDKTAKGNTSTGKTPDEDLYLWRTLDSVLTAIQEQSNNISTNGNSQATSSSKTVTERVPEMIFGQNSISKGKQELEVLMRIRSILPSSKIIWMHIDNYFRSPIHGLFPILNEDWFREVMQTIIGLDTSSDQQPKVNADKRFDISKLGSLLIVLRLSYMSYPESIDLCKTEEERFIISHPIDKEFIDVAQMCLNLFKMMRKGVLPVLHCALLLRVYRRFAEDDGDIVDGTDSETFTGLLVKIATSIGLNTDVAKSNWVKDYAMYVDQWRKCWYIIYFFDFYEALNTGNTFSIDITTFDTKLPEYQMDPATGEYPNFVLNPHLDDVVVCNFQKNFQMTLICRNVLNSITNKRSKVSLIELQSNVNKLDNFIRREYGSNLKIIVDMPITDLPSSVKKINCFKTFVDCNSLIFMVYVHMFIHIDKHIGTLIKNKNNNNINVKECNYNDPKNDISQHLIRLLHHYLKKFVGLYVEIEPVLILCYDSTKKGESKIEEIFGKNSKNLIIQSCEYMVIRFIQGLHVLLSRLLHLHYNYINVPDQRVNFKDQKNFDEIIPTVAKIIGCAISKLAYVNSITRLLSQKYFQVWRMSKGNRFMFSLLSDEKNNIFDRSSEINNEHRQDFSNIPTAHDLNPFKALPYYNTFLYYSLKDFQEILSILSSVKWNIFSNVMEPAEIEEAYNFRDVDVKSFMNIATKRAKNTDRNKKTKKKREKKNSSGSSEPIISTNMDKNNIDGQSIGGGKKPDKANGATSFTGISCDNKPESPSRSTFNNLTSSFSDPHSNCPPKIDDAIESEDFEGKQQAKQNDSSSSITPTTVETQMNLPIDEIDQFWFNTVLNQTNNNLFWSKESGFTDNLHPILQQQQQQEPRETESIFDECIPASVSNDGQKFEQSIAELQEGDVSLKQSPSQQQQKTLKIGSEFQFSEDGIRKPSQSVKYYPSESEHVSGGDNPIYKYDATAGVGLDELFNNKYLLRAHVLQKIQDLKNIAIVNPPTYHRGQATNIDAKADNPKKRKAVVNDNSVLDDDNKISKSATNVDRVNNIDSNGDQRTSNGLVTEPNPTTSNNHSIETPSNANYGRFDPTMLQDLFNTDLFFPNPNPYFGDDI